VAKKFYAVKRGRRTGIFTAWAECSVQVQGFQGAVYKGFMTETEARDWLDGGLSEDSAKSGAARSAKKIDESAERIDADYDQLQMAGGYDHNWVLRGDIAPEPYSHLKKAARVVSKKTGLALSCYTTQVGMQFYTGNALGKKPLIGKGGKEFPRRGGFCLETQFFPNAPANPNFPQPELHMDEVWEAETVYKLDDL